MALTVRNYFGGKENNNITDFFPCFISYYCNGPVYKSSINCVANIPLVRETVIRADPLAFIITVVITENFVPVPADEVG